MVLGAAAALWAGTGRLEDATGAGDLGVTALLVPIAFGVVHTAVLGFAELGMAVGACGLVALLTAAVVLCVRAPGVPAGEPVVPARAR